MANVNIDWGKLTEDEIINLIKRAARELTDAGLLSIIESLEAMA